MGLIRGMGQPKVGTLVEIGYKKGRLYKRPLFINMVVNLTLFQLVLLSLSSE